MYIGNFCILHLKTFVGFICKNQFILSSNPFFIGKVCKKIKKWCHLKLLLHRIEFRDVLYSAVIAILFVLNLEENRRA